MLADVAQQVREQSGDDSISMLETYGSITNPNVRKRDRKGKPVPTPAPVASAAKPIKKEPSPPTTKPAADKKAEEPVKKEAKPAAKESPFSMAAGKKGAAPPPLKKSGSSGIMGSFAKAAAKAASKPKEAPRKAPPVNDSPALSDDGEDDDEDIPAAKPSSDGRKSRKEREADLKRMMEEESEEEEEPEEKEEEPEDEPMEEPEPEPEAKKEPEQSEVVASSGDGRRRGKRKVMKKKQIMDDEGYLGRFCLEVLASLILTLGYQLPWKRPSGRSFQKTKHRNQLPLQLLSPNLRQPQAPAARLRNPRRLRQRDRATSCRSSLRSD